MLAIEPGVMQKPALSRNVWHNEWIPIHKVDLFLRKSIDLRTNIVGRVQIGLHLREDKSVGDGNGECVTGWQRLRQRNFESLAHVLQRVIRNRLIVDGKRL